MSGFPRKERVSRSSLLDGGGTQAHTGAMTVQEIAAAAQKHIKRESTARFTAWGEWADGTRVTGAAGKTGPQVNRQTIDWKRQGATRVGYTRDAA